jgi:hypothetical protein
MKRSLAAVTLGAAMLAACSDRQPLSLGESPSMNVAGAHGPTVMTRNIYLGADLDPVVGAPSIGQLPFIAAEVWAEVHATDFPARAGALAGEIAQANPHLVGLQEVAMYRLQSPGDAVFGGSTPATEVVYDFLQILLDSIEARGLSYVIAAQVTNSDVELPVFTGASPIPFDDVRFMDRDVILARSDIALANPQGAHFMARLEIPAGGPGGPVITQLRGWTSVDATVGAHTFRFVNTHLEVQSFAPIQLAQAAELITMLGASPLPVVLVGDFNSAADRSQTATYGNLLAAGYRDVWNRVGAPGYTCCHAKDLRNKHPELDQRLDIIFLRGFADGVFAAGGQPRIVGDRTGDRTRDGLWPSDHAGVVATLRLPPR